MFSGKSLTGDIFYRLRMNGRRAAGAAPSRRGENQRPRGECPVFKKAIDDRATISTGAGVSD